MVLELSNGVATRFSRLPMRRTFDLMHTHARVKFVHTTFFRRCPRGAADADGNCRFNVKSHLGRSLLSLKAYSGSRWRVAPHCITEEVFVWGLAPRQSGGGARPLRLHPHSDPRCAIPRYSNARSVPAPPPKRRSVIRRAEETADASECAACPSRFSGSTMSGQRHGFPALGPSARPRTTISLGAA